MSNTIKLFESFKQNLVESAREDLLLDIKFIKSLLGRNMNDENYEDKTDEQLEIILKKYKDEFNKSGIDRFITKVTIYNKDTNSGKVGFLGNDTVVEKQREALIFNTKKEAKQALENYEVPEDYVLVDDKIYKIKF